MIPFGSLTEKDRAEKQKEGPSVVTPSHFCPHCGADNAPGETLCCACQQPLDAPGALPKTSRLLNKRYEILTELGTGGFSAVYKARDLQAYKNLVAVKQINLQKLSPREIIEATNTFNREAQILSSLSHPLLPRILDRFSDPEHWYLVMTFIDGQTLDEYIEERLMSPLPGQPGLPLDETLTIALQLCDVLSYLHTRQPPVIFRDLKPGNIMRTRSGRLYLIDFGIARHFKPGQARDTIPFGSPGFAAPEQYGRAQTTPQSDIYSLGALCFFLVSGNDPSEHPFHFPPLQFSGMDGLHELDTLIQRMVALDPAQRPSDVLEVRNTLQHISQQIRKQQIWLPPEGQTPPAISQNPAGKTSRRRMLTGSLIVGGVLLTGGLATYMRSHQPQASLSGQSWANPTTTAPTPTKLSTAEGAPTATTTSQMVAVPVPLNGMTCWSQDLRYAAVTNLTQNQIKLYKVEGQQLIQTLNVSANFFLNIRLQWSLDNSKILATSDDGRIKVWNTNNGQELFTFTTPATRFTLRASWSPDGNYCVLSYLVKSSIPYTVFLRVSDGKQLFQMSVPGYTSYALAWSPDSRYIAFPDGANWYGGTSWTADIWERETFQKVSSFGGVLPSTGEYFSIENITWSPGGKQIATFVNNILWLSQFSNLQLARFFTTIPKDGVIYGPVWSPNEQFLAALAVLPPGILAVWDTSSGQVIKLNGNGSQDALVAFTWSADSKSIIAVDNDNVLSQWMMG
jgi:eukaryotic-like serine/threonine-protein kinase